MFIKVTRRSDDKTKVQLMVPTANIQWVCTGYENAGSRFKFYDLENEILVEESVSEIWRMVGGR